MFCRKKYVIVPGDLDLSTSSTEGREPWAKFWDRLQAWNSGPVFLLITNMTDFVAMQWTEGTQCSPACFQVCRMLSPAWAMETLLWHRGFGELAITHQCWPAVRLWIYPTAKSVVWIELIELPMNLKLAGLGCVWPGERWKLGLSSQKGLVQYPYLEGCFQLCGKAFHVSESRGNVPSMKVRKLPVAEKNGYFGWCGLCAWPP